MGGDTNIPNQTSTTTNTTSQPWEGAAQYLRPTYQKISDFATNNATLTPEMQAINDSFRNQLGNQANQISTVGNNAINSGNQLINGAYNTNYGPVTGAQSLKTWGGADPTAALQQGLSGQINNPYLDQINQGSINQALQGYNRALTDFNQTTMPSIAEDAFANGGYGGSRQGIAQGIASQQMLRNASDLGQSAMSNGAQLYGGAYQNAQNLQNSTAQNMANLGVGIAQNNVTQGMEQAQNNAGNLVNGINSTGNALNNLLSGQQSNYNQSLQLAYMPQTQQMNMLQAMLGALTPGASLGGSTSEIGVTPYYSNTTGQVMGGLASGAGLLSSLGKN